MNINAQIIGLEPIQARLRAVGNALQNPQPMLKEIGEDVVESTKLRFTDGKGPDGNKWAPLSAATLLRRRKKGKGAQPLLDTGSLRNSITKRVDARSVWVGTNVVYAPTHQFGATKGAFGTGKYKTRKGSFPIPWGNIPARPYLGFSRDDQAEIVAIIQRRIAEAGGATA